MTKDNHKYGSNTDSRAADGTFGPTNPEGPGGSRQGHPNGGGAAGGENHEI